MLNYYPRYDRSEQSEQYSDFCRVKLMLNYLYSSPEELLSVDGEQFDTFVLAYAQCLLRYAYEPDHYSAAVEPEVDEFVPRVVDEELAPDSTFQVIARACPNRPPTQEELNLLGRRDIDLQYDWGLHVSRYSHATFLDRTYWREVLSSEAAPAAEFVL